MTGGGRRPDPELDRLSNLLNTSNDHFGNVPWADADRVHRLITRDIPERVAADVAYANAHRNSDRQGPIRRFALSTVNCATCHARAEPIIIGFARAGLCRANDRL